MVSHLGQQGNIQSRKEVTITITVAVIQFHNANVRHDVCTRDDFSIIAVTHFYGLVPLGQDQSAETQFNAMKSRFEEDNTWNSLKANLVALIVDGMHAL